MFLTCGLGGGSDTFIFDDVALETLPVINAGGDDSIRIEGTDGSFGCDDRSAGVTLSNTLYDLDLSLDNNCSGDPIDITSIGSIDFDMVESSLQLSDPPVQEKRKSGAVHPMCMFLLLLLGFFASLQRSTVRSIK